jgi:hypothetical protein
VDFDLDSDDKSDISDDIQRSNVKHDDEAQRLVEEELMYYSKTSYEQTENYAGENDAAFAIYSELLEIVR